MKRSAWRLSLVVAALMVVLSWTIADPALAASYPVGSGPWSVATGDVNGDGRTDIVAANRETTTVSVLLGNGDGTFQPKRDFEVGFGNGPSQVEIRDVNRDGRLDIIAFSQSGWSVNVLLGNGDGTFQPAMRFTTGGDLPESMAVGDFNGDGNVDVAVVHFSSHNVTMLLGTGDGTFQPAYVVYTFPVNMPLIPVKAGDVNGDGRLDLVMASLHGDLMAIVMLGNGDGTFQPPWMTPMVGSPEGIAIADLNGDGRMDIVFSNDDSHRLSVLLGNGNGTFGPVQYYDDGGVGAEEQSVVAADFNGDGRVDLFVSHSLSNDVSVLLGRGDGTFQAPLTYPAGNQPQGVAVGDFNGDGKPDAVVVNYMSNTVDVLLGNGDGTLSAVPFASTPVLTPTPGIYVSSVVVTITDSTPGATIYYTTDGSAPTTASTPYAGPISLTQTTTIKAIAVAPDYTTSAVATGLYTIQVAMPRFSVPAGTYSQPQSVRLSDDTSGATIYYTTDGSTPTTASTPYTGPIAVTQTTTIKAIAAKAGLANSAVATAVYTLQAAAPTFNPPGGSYTLPQLVALSDSSPGATIYYTTDGSTPTMASTRYTDPILVVKTTTIRAIAVVPGWSASPVASATYTFPLGL